MNIKKCDKCGKEISTWSGANAIFPIYKITKICSSPVYEATLEIDLCSKCQENFSAWLGIKEEDSLEKMQKKIDELEKENITLKVRLEENKKGQNKKWFF